MAGASLREYSARDKPERATNLAVPDEPSMDIFERQLKELTRGNSLPTVSDHCKHVAIRLLRRLKNGTRGHLEIRYLLEDLLHSLPPEGTLFSDGNTSRSDPYYDIRRLAKLFTSQAGINIPLKVKPKRPASIDATSLINDAKRSKVNAADNALSIQQKLSDVQLLYDLFNDIDRYTSSGQEVSMLQILGQAVSTGSIDQSTATHANPPRTAASGSFMSDSSALQNSIDALLPPAPRGQALRDRLITSFRRAQQVTADSKQSRAGTDAYLTLFEGLTDILSRLCAPVRDEQIGTLKDTIATCREYLSMDKEGSKLLDTMEHVEDKIRSLVQDMHRDFRLFEMGITVATRDESELAAVVRKESMLKEMEIITQLYGDPLQRTRDWSAHITHQNDHEKADILSRTVVGQALVEALFQTRPVYIQLETSKTIRGSEMNEVSIPEANVLPPIFHFAAKHLFNVQNRLQALTILATLSTLIPASHTKPSMNGATTSTPNKDNDMETNPSSWSDRLWILLLSEMQDGRGTTTVPENPPTHVKIANLADEIVNVLRSGRLEGWTKVEEDNIRSSVDRMLRLEDRVFALLHSRLKNAVSEAIIGAKIHHTGMDVKGFYVAPLPREIFITVKQLIGIKNWACECWSIAE